MIIPVLLFFWAIAQQASVHEILPARIREWVAISSSRYLLDSGIKPKSPALGREILYHWCHLGSLFVKYLCMCIC